MGYCVGRGLWIVVDETIIITTWAVNADIKNKEYSTRVVGKVLVGNEQAIDHSQDDQYRHSSFWGGITMDMCHCKIENHPRRISVLISSSSS
jgi:hypothetical protein